MSVSGRDFFRTAILRRSLNKYYSLNIHNSELNDKFSLLARELNKKNVIDTSYEFLKNTYVMHNESIPHKSKTKILLSCFMIDKHPHVLLSDETDIEKKVQFKAKCILKNIDNINSPQNNFSFRLNTKIFIKNFQDFLVIFDEWKNEDKLKILNDLHTIYFELQGDKMKRECENNPNQEVFIKDIEREQKKIVEKIKHIGGQEGLDNFEKLKKQMNNYTESIERNFQNINNIIHTAFWDNIKEELSKENMNVIIPLLDDLKKMLKQCVPNRGDLHNQLDSNIDTAHIKDMIKNKVIDNFFIRTISLYIFNFVEQFQSSSDDKETRKIKESLILQFDGGMLYKDYFPEFFKHVFLMTEKILKESEELKKMPIYENIQEMYKNHKRQKKF